MNIDNQITNNLNTLSLPINEIRIDGNTQYRMVIDQPTVYNYRDAIKRGDELPLIDVVYDGKDYWLTDGFHRYHAFKLLGIREIQVNCKNGCLRDAQIEALKANCQHGKPLTNEDKRNKVEMALKIEGFDKKTNYEIAKICQVSQPFVAAIRDPAVKQKQKENDERRNVKKAKAIEENTNGISTGKPLDYVDPYVGQAPDDDEIKAAELALLADQEAMYKLLEADDALRVAVEENKRLNLLIAQWELRMHGLMNEKNECIKMINQLQKENTRLKKIKQTASQNPGQSTLEEFRGY